MLNLWGGDPQQGKQSQWLMKVHFVQHLPMTQQALGNSERKSVRKREIWEETL